MTPEEVIQAIIDSGLYPEAEGKDFDRIFDGLRRAVSLDIFKETDTFEGRGDDEELERILAFLKNPDAAVGTLAKAHRDFADRYGTDAIKETVGEYRNKAFIEFYLAALDQEIVFRDEEVDDEFSADLVEAFTDMMTDLRKDAITDEPVPVEELRDLRVVKLA